MIDSSSSQNATANGIKKMSSPTESGATVPADPTADPSSQLLENAIAESQLTIEPDLINTKLPRELLLRIFSYLDVTSITRSAQVCKYWNSLALDGSNWQYVDLFNFQKDVNIHVVENIAHRCNDFLKAIRLENCRFLTDEAIK